jgi:hypothetical protein
MRMLTYADVRVQQGHKSKPQYVTQLGPGQVVGDVVFLKGVCVSRLPQRSLRLSSSSKLSASLVFLKGLSLSLPESESFFSLSSASKLCVSLPESQSFFSLSSSSKVCVSLPQMCVRLAQSSLSLSRRRQRSPLHS